LRVGLLPAPVAPLGTSVRQMGAFAKFVESVKSQVKQNPKLAENVNMLKEETKSFAEMEAIQKAKGAFQKAKVPDHLAAAESLAVFSITC
jgi:hypothetical protein